MGMSKNLLFFIIGNAFLITLTYLTRKRKRLNNFILLFTTLFLFLSIFETVYRNIIHPAHAYFQKSDNAFFSTPDSLLGFQVVRTGVLNSTKLTSSGDTIFDANYTITADSDIHSFSFIHRTGYQDPDAPNPKLIFLGCSFTFGVGVSDSETLPYRSGSLQNISTLNLGGVGYGIHQVYEIFMDKYANKDNKNKTFIYTMIPDHVLRASGFYLHSFGPSYKIAGDSLIYNGPMPAISNKLAYYSSLFGCYSFIKDIVINIEQKEKAKRVSAGEYQKAYLMIRTMSQDAKETGGRFLLLFWDMDTKSTDPNRYYRQILEDKLETLQKDSVTIIRVSDIFDTKDPKYYFPIDGHPTAMAYDTVAKYVAKYLAAH